MDCSKQIQWFPGHMAKAKRKLKESIKLADIAIEVVDSRIPLSSRGHDLNSILGGKPYILVLNKSDIADDNSTQEWLKYFNENKVTSTMVDSLSGKNTKSVIKCIYSELKQKIKSQELRGIKHGIVRAIVIGIPNTGKSSLINRLSGSAKARVEDRPGVTRSNQWFQIDKGLELLDTPGLLAPKISSVREQENLAFTGAIKDDILDSEQLAVRLLEVLKEKYPGNILKRFGLSHDECEDIGALGLLELIGKKRGALSRGGKADTLRAAHILLSEFRSSRLGRITLENVRDII